MPLYKYDNTSDYHCNVCNSTIQRRCVIKHFNTVKHKNALIRKKQIVDNKKTKIKIL